MLTRWLLYPYAHTLYCTKYHKIPVNGYYWGYSSSRCCVEGLGPYPRASVNSW